MKHSINTICFTAVLLHLGGGTAFAQSAHSTTDLNPVVVTGTGTYHRSDNSPVAVKVITAKELKDTHVLTLQEALTRLTTHITTHTSGMGTFVNFNGISDDYIVILENGKRVSGDDRWSRISLANVRRIEIFSGAASALYGSDAIAGVINIITDDSKEPVSASSTTKVMNHGRLDEDIAVDFTAGKFSSHTSYTYHQADNWQVNRYQALLYSSYGASQEVSEPEKPSRVQEIVEALEALTEKKMNAMASQASNLTAGLQSALFGGKVSEANMSMDMVLAKLSDDIEEGWPKSAECREAGKAKDPTAAIDRYNRQSFTKWLAKLAKYESRDAEDAQQLAALDAELDAMPAAEKNSDKTVPMKV